MFTPLTALQIVLRVLSLEEGIEKMSNVRYSSVVGNLMYPIMCTRHNLSYAVNVVSRYMHNPSRDHWEESFIM